jgi:hypothetical protein
MYGVTIDGFGLMIGLIGLFDIQCVTILYISLLHMH